MFFGLSDDDLAFVLVACWMPGVLVAVCIAAYYRAYINSEPHWMDGCVVTAWPITIAVFLIIAAAKLSIRVIGVVIYPFVVAGAIAGLKLRKRGAK